MTLKKLIDGVIRDMTPEEEADLAALRSLLAQPKTQAQLDAVRDAAVAVVDDGEAILRAAVLTLADELNLHAATIGQILSAGANAASLVGFKTAMAAIPGIPQRSPAQIRAAIRDRLGS